MKSSEQCDKSSSAACDWVHCKKSVTLVSTPMAPKNGERWKMPPLVKIYEAFGALGDGRVQLEDERHASVLSSDRSKTYQVEISEDGRDYSRTIEEVMQRAEKRGFDSKMIAAEAEAMLSKLGEFAPLRGSRRRPARPIR